MLTCNSLSFSLIVILQEIYLEVRIFVREIFYKFKKIPVLKLTGSKHRFGFIQPFCGVFNNTERHSVRTRRIVMNHLFEGWLQSRNFSKTFKETVWGTSDKVHVRSKNSTSEKLQCITSFCNTLAWLIL